MKINESRRIGAINPYMQHSDGKRPGTSHTKGSRKDEVQISSQAKELLESAGSARNSENSQRLDALKEAIDSGTYHVEAGKIAEKLLPYIK